jgi:hypothetical protein
MGLIQEARGSLKTATGLVFSQHERAVEEAVFHADL